MGIGQIISFYSLGSIIEISVRIIFVLLPIKEFRRFLDGEHSSDLETSKKIEKVCCFLINADEYGSIYKNILHTSVKPNCFNIFAVFLCNLCGFKSVSGLFAFSGTLIFFGLGLFPFHDKYKWKNRRNSDILLRVSKSIVYSFSFSV